MSSSAIDSAFGDSVALDNTEILLSSTKLSTPQMFPLFKLPLELRGLIYESLIQAGDLSILRVSKLVNYEAALHIPQAAILRLNLGSRPKSRAPVPLNGRVTSPGVILLTPREYVQRLDLRLNMVLPIQTLLESKLIWLFGGKEITRKSCKITIKYGLLGPTRNRMSEHAAYRAISALTGFKTLTLRLEHHRDADCEATLFRIFGPAPVSDVEGIGRTALARDYETVFDFLTVTLGPAQQNNNVDSHCLTFWPRAKS